MSKNYNNLSFIESTMLTELKEKPELKPIFTILEDASKVVAKRSKFVNQNNIEKNKLIAKRDELNSQIEQAMEDCDFLKSADLEEERDRLNLKIESIDAKLIKMQNIPTIDKEEYEMYKRVIKSAYVEYVKGKAETVFNILKPLEHEYDEANALIKLVNDAFHIVQYELYRDNATGRFSERCLHEHELFPLFFMRHIFDSKCIDTLNKIKEGSDF